MLTWRRGLVFAVGLWSAAGAAPPTKNEALARLVPVADAQQIPVIDFFRPRRLADPKLNPAGTHLAVLGSTEGDGEELLIFDLERHTSYRLAGGKSEQILFFRWLTDDRILFSTRSSSRYWEGLSVGEIGPDPRVTYFAHDYEVVPIGVPKKNPLRPVFVEIGREDEPEVVEIDVQRKNRWWRTGLVSFYPVLGVDTPIGFLADQEGEMGFGLTCKDGVESLFRFAEGHWRRCPVDLDQIKILGAGEVRGELIILGPRQPGRPRAIQRLDALSGQLGEVLYQSSHYDPDFSLIYRHPVSNRILGFEYNGHGVESVWIDPRYESIQAELERRFPGLIVRIVGSDRAENRFVVTTFSDRQPSIYWRVDRAAGSAETIENSVPWLDPARMLPMQLFTYRARDGSPLEGYLTLPAGASPENRAPLVVLAHGGPWSRDGWGWDAKVQFFASRGYAVFQPNYRGSLGCGWNFPEDDQWAFRKMHDDVTDGVQAVLANGLIDPGRIAIMGTSFGGYLALCGAAFEPDRYRCAITIAGVFDWVEAMRQDQERAPVRYGYYRRQLGDPREQRKKLGALSPLQHLERVRIPIFVIHGWEDSTVSIEQSKRLARQLARAHIPCETRFVEAEGHGITRLDDKIEIYTAIEAFLAQNLGPQRAAPRPPG